MALAFWVDHPDAIGMLFAAHDEYLAIFTYFNNKKKDENGALTPEDAYYSAPFCFMPKKDKRSGFIIFTCQVPWLSGNPKKSSDDDEAARPHEQAREWMAERGTFSKKAPHVGSVEFFQDELSLKEDEIYCFTKDGCYPNKNEISQALEDEAVGITCAAMGWKEPKDWRSQRERKRDTHKIPFLDLADWDKKQQQQQQQQQRNKISNRNQKEGHGNDGIGNNSTPRKENNNEHKHGTRQDEKKDEDQYQC